MLCFLFDVFSLEVKSRPKMKWITKEELERDLNELLPDKDVCDIIMLYIRMKNLYRACFPSFSRKRVRLLVRSFRAFVCLLVHSFSFFFCACFFFLARLRSAFSHSFFGSNCYTGIRHFLLI